MNKIIKLIFLLLIPTLVYGQGSENALDFDGSNDYVNINSVADNMAGQQSAFSFLSWVKAASTHTGSTKGTILGLNDNDGFGSIKLCLFVGGNGDNRIAVYESTYELTGSVFGDNTWHHVAYVRNGPTGTLYVDGISQGTHSASQTFESDDLWSIGQEWDTPWPTISDALDGQVDEVSIWKTNLSQTQVRDYMCKKLTGSETNLVAYYRSDESSGTSLPDLTSYGNDGTVQNGASWVTSGAPIGDASTYDYDSGGGYTVNLASSYNDDVTATTTSGTVSGIQLYRVDEAPNVTTPPGEMDQLSQHHYFGVLAVGSSVIYTVTYNYDGHPGISDENNLKLAKRDDNADGSWSDAGATLDTDANTLTKTGESGTEYILGSTSGNALPIALIAFTAHEDNGIVVLKWTTENEIGAIGFKMERCLKQTGKWQLIVDYLSNSAFVCLQNQPGQAEYSCIDEDVVLGNTYFYRLSEVNMQGQVKVLEVIEITLNALPKTTRLQAAYPNPFNPQIRICYDLAEDAMVDLRVYNVLGQKIRYLLAGVQQPGGSYNLSWNGRDDTGQEMTNGTYIVVLKAGDYMKSQKILLLR